MTDTIPQESVKKLDDFSLFLKNSEETSKDLTNLTKSVFEYASTAEGIEQKGMNQLLKRKPKLKETHLVTEGFGETEIWHQIDERANELLPSIDKRIQEYNLYEKQVLEKLKKKSRREKTVPFLKYTINFIKKKKKKNGAYLTKKKIKKNKKKDEEEDDNEDVEENTAEDEDDEGYDDFDFEGYDDHDYIEDDEEVDKKLLENDENEEEEEEEEEKEEKDDNENDNDIENDNDNGNDGVDEHTLDNFESNIDQMEDFIEGHWNKHLDLLDEGTIRLGDDLETQAV
ncbi:hypothetical protein RFI_11564, partial [Reticulomyxa filosa]